MKSKKSRKLKPRSLKSPQIPLPSDDGIPKSTEPTNTKIQVNLRPQPNLSLKIETTVSIREIDDVSAAKSTSKKNATPTKVPAIPGIESNTCGRVMNIRPGPAPRFSGCPFEKAYTAGITIIPAKKAIPVSKNSICLAEDLMLTSFFIYEPYVIIMPIARLIE